MLVTWLLVAGLAAARCDSGGSQARVPSPEPGPPAALTEEAAPVEANLRLVGSDTLLSAATDMAQAYMAQHPGVVIDVQGGGSGLGVTAVGKGEVDIGTVSRNVSGAEFKKFPYLHVSTVAYDGLGIATHPDVKLPGLTVEQLRAIFAGEITNFKDVGGPEADIITVANPAGTGTRGMFEELVMTYREGGKKISKDMVVDIQLEEGGPTREEVLSSTPHSIASIGFDFGSLSPVPINGAAPTDENVLNGSYLLVRPLSLLTPGQPEGLARDFIDFALSAEGQEILARYHIPTGLLKMPSQTLDMAGSSALTTLGQKLGQEYMAQHPDVLVRVQEGGSELGVVAVGEGGVNIGNVGREVTAAEFEKFPGLLPVPIGYEGLAIVVNPKLGLPALTIDQLRAIFAGEITNFRDVGGPNLKITVVLRKPGSSTRATFEDLVMRSGSTGEEEAPPIIAASEQNSSPDVVETVAGNRSAIGYVAFSYLNETVKALPIDGTDPTSQNVQEGLYPLVRPLNMVTNGTPDATLQAFLDFVLGPQGQTIVAEENYIPAVAPDAPEAAAPDSPAETPAAEPVEPPVEPVPMTGETTVPPAETPAPEATPEPGDEATVTPTPTT